MSPKVRSILWTVAVVLVVGLSLHLAVNHLPALQALNPHAH
jgi:hypothetical protein